MILRATIFHTPSNPFLEVGSLVAYEDGALLVADGVIQAIGDYSTVQQTHPTIAVRDLRDGIILPGFIDIHIHYPQVRVLGGIGLSLLEWLRYNTLPEEAKFASIAYARAIAAEFVHSVASHGTTTALVFGSHFAAATAALFDQASISGLRIISGQVLSDRHLLPELHQTPEAAYQTSTALIRRFHRQGRLLYAVTPRFALSTSDEMLDVCHTLMQENPDIRFQTHMNESPAEVKEVADLFPAAADYFEVYERHRLAGPLSVFAHSIHTTDAELKRMADHRCSVAYCPSSNAALGSGFFPLGRHLSAGVRFALGTDVGGGTGFGMLKEGLQAYLLQRLASDGMTLNAGHLLYLSTRAGAEALGLADQIGDFGPGKSADYLYLRPPTASPLAAVMRNAQNSERLLASIFTLAGAECVQEVYVQGDIVYKQEIE